MKFNDYVYIFIKYSFIYKNLLDVGMTSILHKLLKEHNICRHNHNTLSVKF